MAPAYAKDDGPEDQDAQTQEQSNSNEASESSSNGEERQDKAASKSNGEEAAQEAASDRSESDDVSPAAKAEAPGNEPFADRPAETAKPAKAEVNPAPGPAPSNPAAVVSPAPKSSESAVAPKAAVVPAAAAPAASPSPASTQSATAAPPVPLHDVYSERTDEILKSEPGKSSDKVHPLQLRYPGHNVVVCTAGCGPGGTVVHKRAKGEPRAVETAVMVPSSARASDAPAAVAGDTMTCIAGCFTTPKSLRVIEKRADLVAVKAPDTPGTKAQEPLASPAAIADQLSGKWLPAPDKSKDVPVPPSARP